MATSSVPASSQCESDHFSEGGWWRCIKRGKHKPPHEDSAGDKWLDSQKYERD